MHCVCKGMCWTFCAVGTDFQLFEGGSTEADVFFDVGQTSQNVSLSFVDDIFPENDETFEVLLTASPGVFLSPLTRTMVTIYNEDANLPGERGAVKDNTLSFTHFDTHNFPPLLLLPSPPSPTPSPLSSPQ